MNIKLQLNQVRKVVKKGRYQLAISLEIVMASIGIKAKTLRRYVPHCELAIDNKLIVTSENNHILMF